MSFLKIYIFTGLDSDLCVKNGCITLGLNGDNQVLNYKMVIGLKLFVNSCLFPGIKDLMIPLRIQNVSTWNECCKLFIVTGLY